MELTHTQHRGNLSSL